MPSKRKLPRFDKYHLYTHSVQGAEHDAELIWKMYQRAYRGNLPERILMQEDFCGTAALCYEWAKLRPQFEAVGIDLDDTALAWGKLDHGSDVSLSVRERVATVCGDVLIDHHIRPHIICALNFSYFFLEERAGLLNYFRTAARSLNDRGLLVLDSFGGPTYLAPHRDKRRNAEEKFTYWWNVESFDAISHKISCHIDFQRDGEPIRKKVFVYHWRLWSIPEIRDVLLEAGFNHVEFWSEGLDTSGSGDGKYRPVIKESDCEAWVCYIVARK